VICQPTEITPRQSEDEDCADNSYGPPECSTRALTPSMRSTWLELPTAKDWANVLAWVPLFAGLTERQLRRVAELARIGQFEKGEIVIQAGDKGRRLRVAQRPGEGRWEAACPSAPQQATTSARWP